MNDFIVLLSYLGVPELTVGKFIIHIHFLLLFMYTKLTQPRAPC